MASNITADTIDSAFPVAGQDNNSQGFRDNFTLIKNSLVAAKSEIETLQDDTAKLNVDNNFNGVKLENYKQTKVTEVIDSLGELTANTDISWEAGSYQQLQVAADIQLTLADWPAASQLASLKLQLVGDGTERVITWAIEAGGTLKTDTNWPSNFTVTSATDPVFVEFWTIQGGVTVFGRYLGQYTA
jgi:hypothetical protein